MKNNTLITRAAAPALVLLLLAAALFALLTAVPAVGAAPDGYNCANSSMDRNDCKALVELYKLTNGDAWTNKTNWLEGSPCSATEPWFGVVCNGTRVQQVILTDNNLQGTLPASLLNRNKLELLHLGKNRIGGAIPEVTIDDSEMIGLYLHQNAFEGEIPASLGNLTALEFLYLNGNMLTGTVPPDLCSLKPISELTGSLNLNYNALPNDEIESGVCLDSIDSGWRDTQTVAPEPRLKDVSVATTTSDGQLTIRWTPIEFTHGGGFYEVFMATKSGDFGDAPVARTTTKEQNSVEVGGIEEGVDYFFVVRTKSFANEFNPNVVTSEFSDEITNNPVAVTLTDFQAHEQNVPTHVIVAAVVLMGILSSFALASDARQK